MRTLIAAAAITAAILTGCINIEETLITLDEPITAPGTYRGFVEIQLQDGTTYSGIAEFNVQFKDNPFPDPPLPSCPPEPVNINTASLEQLDALSGIGPTYAQRIIDYRTENGDFQSIEDIQKVKGIGPATFEDIKNCITITDASQEGSETP